MFDFLKRLIRRRVATPASDRPPAVGAETVRRWQETFSQLVAGVRDYAVFLLDREGNVATWNAGAERIKGYRNDEIIGRHFSTFYPEEAVASGWPAHELAVAADVGRFEDEGWRVRKDGSQFWANVVITALRDEAGEVRGFLKITRDLTDRKQAEEAARRLLVEEAARQAAEAAVQEARRAQEEERRQREQWRVTLTSIGDAVIVTDREGVVTFVNPAAVLLTGWQPQEAAGRPLAEVFHILNEHTRRPVENPVTKVLREGTVVGLANHTLLVCRDGREIPIDDSGAPIRGEGGAIGGVVLVFRDVTDVRRAVEARLHLAAIVESSDDAIISESLDGKIVSWNRGAERLYGYTAEEVVGKPLSVLVPPNLPDEVPALLGRIKAGERVEHYETVRLCKDGRRLNVSLTISPVRDAEGRVVGASKIARDITALKRQEAALKEADRQKNDWIAMLAHELRNPLAPIRNALGVMETPGAGPEAVAKARRMMARQVGHVVRLVDDLLDVSRIVRGRVELRQEAVDLAAVMARGAETAQPMIDERGQELIVSAPAEPPRLRGDPTRLAQVVSNLLHNAAKFSPRSGRIWLTAERQGGEAVLRVRDEGAGIAADVLPRIFDLFAQGDHTPDRSQGGLGIGLSVVRMLVELHGGTVTAHSGGPGKGSEFVVRLPGLLGADTQEPAATHAAPARASAARRVLVVDDNADAADSLALMLRLQGHEVQVAYHGPAALELATEYRPEVVLLDIGMPGMDGYEVARRLRRLPGLEGMRLAAVTGWGQSEDRRRTAEAGFDDHLVKPVDAGALQEVLGRTGQKR